MREFNSIFIEWSDLRIFKFMSSTLNFKLQVDTNGNLIDDQAKRVTLKKGKHINSKSIWVQIERIDRLLCDIINESSSISITAVSNDSRSTRWRTSHIAPLLDQRRKQRRQRLNRRLMYVWDTSYVNKEEWFVDNIRTSQIRQHVRFQMRKKRDQNLANEFLLKIWINLSPIIYLRLL